MVRFGLSDLVILFSLFLSVPAHRLARLALFVSLFLYFTISSSVFLFPLCGVALNLILCIIYYLACLLMSSNLVANSSRTQPNNPDFFTNNAWIWRQLEYGRCLQVRFWLAETVNLEPVKLSCFPPIHLLYKAMTEALATLRMRLPQNNK